MKIRCSTLYDITKTNVNYRRAKLEKQEGVDKQGGQQSNFETIIQCINIRAQPENISDPEKKFQKITSLFGKLFKNKGLVPVWTFTFDIFQPSVFLVDNDELGGLYQDCQNVPMIINLEEWNQLTGLLNTTVEYKNIHFEVIHEENTV